MNGSENGFAGALFFALAAVGILLKVDEVAGWAIGAVLILVAAVCLRHALSQTAIAAEEDHQRIEIQFQQLRQKIGEISSASQSAMSSVTETANSVQESLQGMRSRLTELENLSALTETASAVGATLKNIEDNTRATESALKDLSEKISETNSAIKNNSEMMENLSGEMKTFGKLGEEVKKISEISAENKNSLQTGVKLVGVVGQMLKTPPFASDLTQLNETAEKISSSTLALDDVRESLKFSQDGLNDLVKLVEKISEQSLSVIESAQKMETSSADSAENFRQVGLKIVESNENLTSMFDNVRKELTTLTKKLDAYNGLTRATLDQYSNLTEKDVRVLEKIAERINGG